MTMASRAELACKVKANAGRRVATERAAVPVSAERVTPKSYKLGAAARSGTAQPPRSPTQRLTSRPARPSRTGGARNRRGRQWSDKDAVMAGLLRVRVKMQRAEQSRAHP